MASLMFYEEPVALSTEIHRNFRFDNAEWKFGFARNTNSVVLTGIEFAGAGREYPIVFASASEGQVIPVVLLGLRNSENLCVDMGGEWLGRYIPAFIRRYPFVLAGEDGDLTVCIDASCKQLQKERGEALFDEDGNNSDFLESMVTFLSEYQHEYLKTTEFVKKLQDLELFKPLNATVKMHDGEQLGLTGMLVVDEHKMLELDDASALELFRTGQLGWVYTHLASIGNMGRLVDRVAGI